MRIKRWLCFLGIEAIGCVLFNLFLAKPGSVLLTLAVFPFEQIGAGLRALSLSGRIGSAAALTLYVVICLLPILYAALSAVKRTLAAEDALLPLLSVLLGLALYQFANPSGGSSFSSGTEMASILKGAYGSILWICIVAYAVLRILRRCFQCETDRLLTLLQSMLLVLCVLFVWAAFGASFRTLLDSFSNLKRGNTDGGALGFTYVFLTLQFAVDALPWVLDVVAVLISVQLLNAMRENRYAEETVCLARQLSVFCGRALAATVLSSLAFHVLQLLLMSKLRSISSTLSVPLISLAFVMALLLFSRITAEDWKLKQDNDLMI